MREADPQLTARIFIRDTTNRLLVVRRSLSQHRPHGWELPGGKFNGPEVAGRQPDDSLAQAAVREAREETGIELDEAQLVVIGTQERINGRRMLKRTCYYSTVVDPVAVELSHSHDHFKWMPRPEIPFVGPDTYKPEGADLSRLQSSWLRFFAGQVSHLVDHDAQILPVAYFAAYHWIPAHVLDLDRSLQTCTSGY